jgi:putative transposase
VRPNQRWMIDASPSDVLCLDGRRNLYVVVEVFSRRLLALVTDTPKTTASLLLVARACQAWGMPEELWTDNGSDFKSKHFVMAMRQLGVHHHRTKPYSPELKSFIERAIGTVQHGFMPFLKGYIGHNVASRSKIEARFSFAERMGESTEKLVNAGITSGELQDHISNWISNEYEQTPHGGLGKRTPIDAWHAGWAAVEGEPKFANPLALGGLLMPPARNGIRTVGREGLSVEGIDYVSPHLIVGQKVQVRLDPDDLGTVWVYTDEDPWQFLGIAENLELKGLNRAEAARKARVMQDAFRREGVAYLRDLAKRADMHNVASRMIGEAPLPSPANFDFSHTTPALEEAARAMTTRGRRVIAEPTPEASEKHQRFVETFKADKQIEETPQQRYARWKTLKAEADAGADIPDELKDWFETYPTLPEYRSCEFIDQSFRKNGGE